jgi:hypothetical protein
MKRSAPEYFVLLIVLLLIYPLNADAQLQRKRVETLEETMTPFRAPVNVGISTGYAISKGNLYTTVAHTFGLLNTGIEQFFGLDQGANTRIGLDYGLTDRFSVGIGRMTFNKVVDLKSRIHIVQQSASGDNPLDLAFKISATANTTPGNGFEISDRLSYLVSALIARKFDSVSIQLTPMFTHFNRVVQANLKNLYAVGVLVNYDLNQRFSISAEYLPVIGKRNSGTTNAGALALNIDTGGHVFQLYLSSSQWHNEQFIMANNRDRFLEGDFRFGFNIHRVFGLHK